jgi:putative FmdB family regulatory protein
MPIYEYACAACGKRHEVLQKISEEPLTICPDCGAAELRKLVSKAGFRLKGTGWYETDFKDGKRHNVVRDEGSAPGEGGAGEKGDKGEKKPESSGEATKSEGSAAKEKNTDPSKSKPAPSGGDTAAA